MLPEGVRCPRSQAYRATALLRLRLPQGVESAGPRQRAPDAHGGVLQIDVLSLEGQQLSLPHAGVDGENVEGLELVALRCIEELARLYEG